MNLDSATVTALTGAAVAGMTALVAWTKKRDDKVGRRIDQAFNANQALVDDLRNERGDLIAQVNRLNARVVELERGREENSRDIRRLRDTLSEQAQEMSLLRQREHEMREWAHEIIVPWIGQAIGVVRGLGGAIHEPPPPPYSRF